MDSQSQPPPGGDESRAGSFIALTVTTTGVAGVFVAVRMYTRLAISRAVGWDDYTIILALVSYVSEVLIRPSHRQLGPLYRRHGHQYCRDPSWLRKAFLLPDA